MNNVTKDIIYIGVNDHNIDLFEGQYDVPNGMAYNSYLILDDKIAILDTVDVNFKDEWLNNLNEALNGKNPDYLIVQHMEPDHSANIMSLISKYPNITVVGNAKTFKMIEQFFNTTVTNKMIVLDNDKLNLGHHELTFVFAPMVHWPEVMVTYDNYDKVLFSADGFGKFGALDVKEDWACEARRYYFGIVGKYGLQVQNLLKKASQLDIKIICPLHGPVLSDNLNYYINLYDIWSKYEVESEGIVIAYTSIYGNTKKAAEILALRLENLGCKKVVLNDLARSDKHEVIEDAFRYGYLILASPTYNGDIFPYMRDFILNLCERNYSNRTVGFIENGTWAPTSAKIMKEMLSKQKNITYLENNVKILSAVNDDVIKQIDNLANELIK